MPPVVSILATGSEITEGRTVDTNSSLIARTVGARGVSVGLIVACADDLDSIIQSLDYLVSHSDAVIISGGLGPTSDDLTREAVAALTKSPLTFDQGAWERLAQWYAKRNRTPDPSNKKQATFPIDSHLIANANGTAEGFICTVLRPQSKPPKPVPLIALPGVPRELAPMLENEVLPFLQKTFPDAQPRRQALLRIFGVPESVVGARTEAQRLPPEVTISYRASFPEVQVLLKAPANFDHLSTLSSEVIERIGEQFIFSQDASHDLASVCLQLLFNNKKTVAVAESLTGGLLGSLLTQHPGSSQAFWGGVISYTNNIKKKLLHVSETTLTSPGAVSASVAEQMAQGVREQVGSDIGISLTGVAGPDGGSTETPVGTFFVGLATKERSHSLRVFHPGSRDRIRVYAAHFALDALRRSLLKREWLAL